VACDRAEKRGEKKKKPEPIEFFYEPPAAAESGLLFVRGRRRGKKEKRGAWV